MAEGSAIDWLKPDTPYHWFGLVMIILGIVFGGFIGAILAILAGIGIIKIGKHSEWSTTKKIIFSILIALAAFMIYLVFAVAIAIFIYSIAGQPLTSQ